MDCVYVNSTGRTNVIDRVQDDFRIGDADGGFAVGDEEDVWKGIARCRSEEFDKSLDFYFY